LVAAGAGVLMGRRSLIDLMALRIAFERSGRVVAVAEPASTREFPELPAKASESPTEADLDEPDRGKVQWVTRTPVAATGRFDWDYDPWRRGLK
jgi:hypothetical protein